MNVRNHLVLTSLTGVLLASPVLAGTIIDTNGFETSAIVPPESYIGTNDGTDLVGQNGWVAFAGLSSIDVSTNRVLAGANSLRSIPGTAAGTGAARGFAFTPNPAVTTDLIVSGLIGNSATDDLGFGDVGITTTTTGFNLIRLRRSSNSFEAYSANAGLVEQSGATVSAADAAGVAFEYTITLRYNPGLNNDMARIQYRQIGAGDWNLLSPVAGGTLDSQGFVSLGYDAPTGNLFVAVRADNQNFQRSMRFDNLTVSSQVIPEPASLGMFALGAAMVVGYRQSRPLACE